MRTCGAAAPMFTRAASVGRVRPDPFPCRAAARPVVLRLRRA
jgi:hypothetical protein